MISLDKAIASARLIVAAAEALNGAMHTARKALEDATSTLKEALDAAETEREKAREQVEKDHTAEDSALDEKFK